LSALSSSCRSTRDTTSNEDSLATDAYGAPLKE
jgi:hypothetical protein